MAQACDRCRLKKTRCDGKRPQCSQCAAVGFECKVSDRLSRRAFPRGYTETLEERVRELEAENKKLLALLDQKDEQMDMFSKVDTKGQPLSSSNLKMLNDSTHKHENLLEDIPEHFHSGPGCCSNYPHSVHERPVSIAGSVDLEITDDESLLSYSGSIKDEFNPNNVSFEQNQAPGLNAAMAIARMNNGNGKTLQLANLVAMSIPRSTEETLFLPSLLSKIGEVHGFDSKACLSTASSIAALKEIPKLSKSIQSQHNVINFSNINFKGISTPESILFFNSLKLPSKIEMDHLITIYFQEWGMILPVIDKMDFLQQYHTFCRSLENNFNDNSMIHKERFGAILVLVVQLALFSQKNHPVSSSSVARDANMNDRDLILFYDYLIHQLINSNIATTCSIQSLQILSLALFYCLNTGDVVSSYALRGRVITMAQQLRLHRCPSAVLGNSGSAVSKFQQSERRILFWCIYTLDACSSLQLGVPRLLKDYEIECALPFGSDDLDDENNVNILVVNNSKVSLVGKVCNLSLVMMRYSKVLGNILDFIFKRHSKASEGGLLQEQLLIHEGLLDSWRRDLPLNLKFELDVNGLLRDSDSKDPKISLLVLLYYNAKMLIHLPVIASEVNGKRGSASYIVVQQCTLAVLNILSDLYSKKMYYMPVPFNITRTKTRLALLSAKGALEYTRGGALFQESRQILQRVVEELKEENAGEIPGNLSGNCVNLLESAIEAILANKDSKPKLDTTMKKKTSCGAAKKRSPLSNDDSISQMLSQLESAPPILPPTMGQRVPQMFNNSMEYGNLMNGNNGNKKVAPSVVSDVSMDDPLELDFAADGSLGLAPWLDFELPVDLSYYDQPAPVAVAVAERERKSSLFDWQNSV